MTGQSLVGSTRMRPPAPSRCCPTARRSGARVSRSPSVRPFDDEDRALIGAYADLCAQALARVALAAIRERLVGDLEARAWPARGAPPADARGPDDRRGAERPDRPRQRSARGDPADPCLARSTTSPAARPTADSMPNGRRAPARRTGRLPGRSAARPSRTARSSSSGQDGTRRGSRSAQDRSSTVTAGSSPASRRSSTSPKRAAPARTASSSPTPSEVLGSSLDYEETIRLVAELAVPRIGDWCAVDIVDESERPAGSLSPTPTRRKSGCARDLQERYPSDPDSPRGLNFVLRTGQSDMMSDIPDQLVEAGGARRSASEAHSRARAALVHLRPDHRRRRVLGALTFVGAESGRRYDARTTSPSPRASQRAPHRPSRTHGSSARPFATSGSSTRRSTRSSCSTRSPCDVLR